MMELIEYIEIGTETNVYVIRDKAKELLEKEKEQIIDAQIFARMASDLFKNKDTENTYRNWAIKYYNQTYNNERIDTDNDRVY